MKWEALSAVVSLLGGGLGPSADPSQVAIFETYGAVLILNERLGGIEEGLGDLHKLIKDILPDTEKRLRQQSAREAEIDVLGGIEALRGKYMQMLSEIASGDAEGGRARFNEYVKAAHSDIDTKIDILILSSTFELQTAVMAVEVLQAVDFFRGLQWTAIQQNSARYLQKIESQAAKNLDADIEKKRTEADIVQSKISELIGADWWIEGGNRISAKRSFSYAPTFYGGPMNPPVYRLPYGVVHCWTVNVVETSDLTGSSYYTTLNPEQGMLHLPHPQVMGRKPFEFCGSKLRGAGRKSLWWYEAETVGADGKPSWKHLKRIGQPLQVYRDVKPMGDIYRTSRADTARLELLLEQLNILTYRHEIAVAYRKGLLASIEDLKTRTRETTEFSGFDLVKQLADLGTPAPSSIDEILFNAAVESGTLETEMFRANFAEVALAFDLRIAAGQARLDAALADYSKSASLMQIGHFVKLVSQLAATVEVIDASLSKSEGRLPSVKASPPAQLSTGRQTQSRTVTEETAAPLNRGITAVPYMGEKDYMRVVALIDKMSHLPVPGRDPLLVPGPVEFELLAAEAYAIMGGWRDQLVEKYGDELSYDGPNDPNLPVAEKIAEAIRENILDSGSVNPLALFLDITFTSTRVAEADMMGPQDFGALRADLDREASRIMDWRTRKHGVWRLMD